MIAIGTAPVNGLKIKKNIPGVFLVR